MYHFDTLDQRGAPELIAISHKGVLASLNNMVIGNGGSTFLYTFMEGIHFYVFSPFLIIIYFIPSQALKFQV